MKKKNLIKIISIITLIMLLSTALSFAYFTATITGAEETTTITTNAGTMNISYSSGANLNLQNIFPND